jgi:hypothetical protein
MTTVPGDVVVFASAESTDPLPVDPNLDDNSRRLAVGVAEAFSNGAVQVVGTSEILSLASGDLNGDGAADLVAGTAAGQPIQIYLSSGFRDFAATPISLPDTAANVGIALADFDGNGTLDIVVANADGRNDVVFSNDGTGNFTLMATLEATFGQDVAVGDFNGDGAIDIAIATDQANPIYLGDGAGGFVAERPLGSANSRGVAAADFNGDGLVDLVFANTGSSSQVWLRNAGGGFTAGNILPIGDAMAVVVGEFGGGAGPDLAFARVPVAVDDVASNPVLINDGAGNFTPFAALGNSPTADVLAGDVNRDGLLDLVFVNFSGVHQIWTATGTGFDLYREQIADIGSTAGILAELGFADIGDPGGVDLAMGGAPAAGLGVFLNDGLGNLGRGDAVPPVLTLLGAASVQVPSGSVYNDTGATAEDNIDGDISASIVVVNRVNTAVVGDYTVTYNVTDFAGNSATSITRTVTVIPAAGTGGGGGGGGGLSILMLLLLVFAAWQSIYPVNRAIISGNSHRQD